MYKRQAYDIREMGEQLMPLGMLVTLDAIYNHVIQNWKKGRRTWIFCDEFYILFRYESVSYTHLDLPAGGKLTLTAAEYRLAKAALNQLRTQRLSEGGYTDAVDDALTRLLHAHTPLFIP